MNGEANPLTRTIRLWACIDGVATGSFALPPVAPHFVAWFYRLNDVMGGAGEAPVFAPLHWFFVSLAGALGVLWAVVRWRWPERHLAGADAVARLWVAALLFYFVVFEGAPRALALFVLSELGGSVHQGLWIRRIPSGRATL